MHLKRAATALAACLTLGLAACGEKAPAPAPAASLPAADPAKLVSLPAPYNTADLANGKTQFNKCHTCHSFVEAEGNKTGPNLHGVFVRHPGTAPKFRYSNALKAAAFDKWTPEEVDKWLTNPNDYLPGNAMFLDGIKDPNNRRDVIAYLMINS